MFTENGPSPEDTNWKAPETKKPPELSGVLDYETHEGEKVSLQWQLIFPKDYEGGLENEAVIYLPGVALDGRSSPVQESGQDFADAFKTPAFSISSRLENANTEDSQLPQAEAIQKFIEEKGLTEIVIAGNSQGGNKLIDLNYQIQNLSPNIDIKGLALTAPGGVIEQDPSELNTNFFTDAGINTPQELLKDNFRPNQKVPTGAFEKTKNLYGKLTGKESVRAIKLGSSVGYGMAKEAVTAPTQFLKRVKRESREAAVANPRAVDVRVPVVIIVGAKDMAFPSDKFIPTNPDNPELDAHDKTVRAQKMREDAMKKIFPNSPRIRVIEGTKDAVHGMHYIRGEKVPKVAAHMLERMWRELEAQSNETAEKS